MASSQDNRSYFWLNANPAIWSFNQINIGEIQYYTAYNEKGNRRYKYSNFEKVRPGDIIIGYLTSPLMQIVSLCEVYSELHTDSKKGLVFSFKKIVQLKNPIPLKVLKENAALKYCEPIINNNGSLFSIRPSEFSVIYDIIESYNANNIKQIIMSESYM